jgi:hypothetical protein
MKKNLRLFILLFAFMLQCPIMLANNAEGVEINLTQRTKPKQNGNIGPSRAPARRVILPVSAFLNETARCMSVSSTSGGSAFYYIYNEEGQQVDSGIVTFSGDAGSTISLGMLLDGEYTIEVVLDGVAYEGTFYL